jgi:hypothetical protein
MSKRTIAVMLALGLVGGALAAPAQAKKKKPKKPPAPVSVPQQMFLVGDGCVADARGLSVADTADLHTCAYWKGGILGDVIPEAVPAPVGGTPWQTWPAIDGVPLKLDATKPITGEIFTQGLFPLVGDYPGIAAGNVKLTVKVVAGVGGEEKVVGEFVDEFLVTPGEGPHTTEVNITPDAALNGIDLETLTLHTRIGGTSVGQVFYKLDQPSSYITVTTLK